MLKNMTKHIEEYVLGQLLFYPQTRALLPRINAEWFETTLYRKAMKNMITNYHVNEPVDYITTTEGMNPKDRMKIIEIGQNVHDVANVSQYIPKLEHAYLHKKFIENLGKLDLTKGLKELMDDTQTLIESTRFTTINDPESIHKISARALDNITQSIERGERITGKPTGWSTLDRILGGWNAGDLIVMAARPGMGKTALALSLIYEFSKLGGKSLIISLEMSSEQLVKRYFSLITDIMNYKIRNASLSKYEVEKLCDAVNKSDVEFFVDQEPNASLQQLKAKAKVHKAKHGLELLVIDYIQLMTGTKQNREQEIAEISRGLKLLAKELNITVIVLAQLSRKPEERADKKPLLSDIRESGSIEQDADVVLFPFRPAKYEETQPEVEDAELIIAKNRHGECATIQTTYIGNRTLYKENMSPTPF
jgi:replicative DNA helicase